MCHVGQKGKAGTHIPYACIDSRCDKIKSLGLPVRLSTLGVAHKCIICMVRVSGEKVSSVYSLFTRSGRLMLSRRATW